MNIKNAKPGIIFIILLNFISCNFINEYNATSDKLNKILKIDANEKAGFNFPYLLWIPEHVKNLDKASYILFEPNNPHGTYRKNIIEIDEQDAADYLARMPFIVNDKKSNLVLFTPILPRSFNTPSNRYNAPTLCRETMKIETEEYIEIKISWTGEKLWGDDNTVGYNLDDVFVVQDGLIYRCVASIPDSQIGFKNTNAFEFIFFMEKGWDINRPFNFIEHCNSGCFLFKDVYVKNDESINNSVFEWPDSKVKIEKISCSEISKKAWNRDGYEINSIENKIRRLDLQVVNMLQDARAKLKADFGINTYEKICMYGFSGSAMFTQRFCLLHPELIKAAAIGAPGGTYSLGISDWKGEKLQYPVGVSDFKEITGYDFNETAFKKINFIYFIGTKDDNEATNETGYWQILRTLFGETPVNRLRTVESIYKEKEFNNFLFKYYENVSHQHTSEMKDNVKDFFYNILINE